MSLQNPVVRGAASHYDWLHEVGERAEVAAEHELQRLLTDDGAVHEAIAENADIFRVKLAELTQHPERAADIALTLNNTIRAYLEPWARSNAEKTA